MTKTWTAPLTPKPVSGDVEAMCERLTNHRWTDSGFDYLRQDAIAMLRSLDARLTAWEDRRTIARQPEPKSAA